jgi:hypothetical protein
VFAEYDDGELTIDHTFDLQGWGSAQLTVTVVPDEHPPTADHDLGATEECDVSTGLLLDGARSYSTDPDNDVVFELWSVDGVPCGHDCVVPAGSHLIGLEAHDSRGAVHRMDEQWVNVTLGPACCECFG